MSPYAKLSRGMSVSAAFHLRGKDSFVRTREFQTVRLRRLRPMTLSSSPGPGDAKRFGCQPACRPEG